MSMFARRTPLMLGLLGLAVLAGLASCVVLGTDVTSDPGRGDDISCQIICGDTAGGYRDYDRAPDLLSAANFCEEVIATNPDQFADACADVGGSPTGCSCFEEE